MSDTGSALQMVGQVAGAAGGLAGAAKPAGGGGGAQPTGLTPGGGSNALAPLVAPPVPQGQQSPVLPLTQVMQLLGPGGGPRTAPKAPGANTMPADTSGASALGSIASLIGTIALLAAA